jgi:hypothetical protein
VLVLVLKLRLVLKLVSELVSELVSKLNTLTLLRVAAIVLIFKQIATMLGYRLAHIH